LLDYSEELVRRRIERIEDGRYEFEDWLDDDGRDTEPVRFAVVIEVQGSEIHLDFTGTSSQVGSALNATASFTRSAGYAALQAALGDDIPSNGGFYRPIAFTIPKGSILDARRPAARGARGLVGFRIVDVVWGALHEALPHSIPACGDGGCNNVSIGATSDDGTQGVIVDALFGAWGAWPDRDGIDGASPLAANLANTSIEEIERSGAVRVERY